MQLKFNDKKNKIYKIAHFFLHFLFGNWLSNSRLGDDVHFEYELKRISSNEIRVRVVFGTNHPRNHFPFSIIHCVVHFQFFILLFSGVKRLHPNNHGKSWAINCWRWWYRLIDIKNDIKYTLVFHVHAHEPNTNLVFLQPEKNWLHKNGTIFILNKIVFFFLSWGCVFFHANFRFIQMTPIAKR